MLSRELKESGQKLFSGEMPSFATTLVAWLIHVYGLEALNWDALTIQLQIKDDLDVEIPRTVFDKMMALISALTTDSVYKDVAVFDEFVSAINGYGIGVQQDAPLVEDVAWAVAELKLSDPDPVSRNPENPWGPNIGRYIRVVLDDEGYSIAPKVLEFTPDRTPQMEGMDNELYYAGQWGSAQERADEIDTFVEGKALALIQQLIAIGLPLQVATEEAK